MVTEALDECSLELTRIACNLCCITSLLLLLARLSTGMTMEEMLTLMSALPPVMLDGQDQVRSVIEVDRGQQHERAWFDFENLLSFSGLGGDDGRSFDIPAQNEPG